MTIISLHRVLLELSDILLDLTLRVRERMRERERERKREREREKVTFRINKFKAKWDVYEVGFKNIDRKKYEKIDGNKREGRERDRQIHR